MNLSNDDIGENLNKSFHTRNSPVISCVLSNYLNICNQKEIKATLNACIKFIVIKYNY